MWHPSAPRHPRACSGSARVVVHSLMRRNALIILGFAALAWGVAALALDSPSLKLGSTIRAPRAALAGVPAGHAGSLGRAGRHRRAGLACAGDRHRQPGHADQLPRRARGADPRHLGRRLAQRRARGAPARVLTGRRRELRAGGALRRRVSASRCAPRRRRRRGKPVGFQFHADTPYSTANTTDFANLPAAPVDYQSFYTAPRTHPPVMTVTTPDRDPAAGDVFTTNGPGPGQYGPLIYTPQGRLVWFDALPQGEAAEDLNVQTYEGRRVLTWWRGHVLSLGFGQGEDVVMNSRYQTIARVAGGNGLKADLHDFQLAATTSPTSPPTTPSAATSRGAGIGGGGDRRHGHPADRHEDRPRALGMAQPRSRRCRGVRSRSTGRPDAVGLLPHQLDRPSGRRQPVDLRAQHMGRLPAAGRQRQDPLAARRQQELLQDGPGHEDGLAARRARAGRTAS